MELIVLISTGVAFLMVVYYLLVIPLRNFIKFRAIPSPKTLPILGNIMDLWVGQHDLNKCLSRFEQSCGRRFTLWGTIWFPGVVIGNCKDARKLLSSREHVQKGLLYKALDVGIGTGLFNSVVPIWKKRRPHLEQAFHMNVLKKCPTVFDSCSRSLIRLLKLEVGDGKIIDVHPFMNLCAMEMIVEGGFGVKLNIIENANNPLWKRVIHSYERATYLAEFRMLRPWFLFSDLIWSCSPLSKEIIHLCNYLRNEWYQMILDKRRETLRNSAKKSENFETSHIDTNNNESLHPIFLDLLLELQATKKELQLTDEDILDEIASFYIAGHDATGKSLSFTLLYLGAHPECQKKVIEEVDSVFGENNSDQPIREEDLGKLKYLECCIKESLRLSPPVSIIIRTVASDLELDEKAIIPKGTEVAIATYLVHRDETIYTNPQAYLPDRFLPENSRGRDPYAWIPFSTGPRGCLGPKFAMMEMKVVLANFFRNFQIETVGSVDDWVLNTNVTLKLEGGWNVRLIPRT